MGKNKAKKQPKKKALTSTGSPKLTGADAPTTASSTPPPPPTAPKVATAPPPAPTKAAVLPPPPPKVAPQATTAIPITTKPTGIVVAHEMEGNDVLFSKVLTQHPTTGIALQCLLFKPEQRFDIGTIIEFEFGRHRDKLTVKEPKNIGSSPKVAELFNLGNIKSAVRVEFFSNLAQTILASQENANEFLAARKMKPLGIHNGLFVYEQL